MRKRPWTPSAARRRVAAAPIVALEKRIAFDAAAAATAAKAVRTTVAADFAHHPLVDATRETAVAPRDPLANHGLARTDATGTARALRGIDLGTGDVREPALTPPPKSVVFIESDVPDIASLIKDVDHSARIVLLDPRTDGVDAIASYLAAHNDVQDVYIFSHGSQGQLDLGTAVLDPASMQGRYANDLATIKSSLAPGANILVYGCDFAEGSAGDAAAHLLSQLTGAAVAASTNLTGGSAEGGDFVLEDHVGTIDAPTVLSARIVTDYDGLLATAPTTIFANSGTGAYHGNVEFLTFANTSIASGGITNGATATYTTANGSTVKVTFSNVSNATDAATFKPAALSAYSPSQFYKGYNNTAATSALLYGQYNDTASFTVTFSATDKNGKSYNPNIAFSDGEVTQASGEYYSLTTNGGNFQNVETIGKNDYSLTGVGSTSVKLQNTVDGVPLLVTDGATSLNVTVQIAGGKEGFVLALVDPTLSLDANASSGASAGNYQTTFTEKGSAVAIADSDTSAVEPGGSASSAKIVLTNAQAGDVLAIAGSLPSGITSSIDTSVAGQITVTLSGASTLAAYQTAIGDVTFANTSSDPSTADRTISVTYNDGGQDSNTAISTVHVTAVNDAPVETVPGAQTTNKDTTLSISGMSVSDVDANGGTETVTLSVSDGTISLASTSGLTFSKGTGTNDTTETFTGTLSAVNNAIATVKYQPTTGYVGSDTLNFSTNDNGNTGAGGAMTASSSVGITVNNVDPTAKGTIANQKYTDGQANVSIATSQAFSDSLGLTLTYSATGLPKGLTIDATTGKITGTVDHDASTAAPSKTGSGATLDGTYTVVETASDGQGGSTTQTFTIDATNQAPVVGTKTANQSNSDGDTITAVNAAAAFSDPNGDPLTYTATGLPAGLSISSAGVITGTVAKNAQPGTDSVTVTATDDKGAATSETFNWVVKDVPPTANGTLSNQSYNDGQAGISIATASGFTDSNGNALTYSASGLPKGLTIDPTTGKITGTIDHDASTLAPKKTGSGATLDGTYTITETAADGLGGTATQSFTIDSKNGAPTLGTSTANQANNDGDKIASVDTSKAFSDPNGDPLTYTATGLPAGLSISSAGVITGTVAKNAQPGTDSVTVTATDDKGAATSETFNWVVKDVPPTANGTLSNQSYNDGQAGISIATASGFTDSNGNALTYSASGLPKGLTIDPTTGKITGTIDHDASTNSPKQTGSGATLDGTYTVTETAADGLGGTATQTFTIDSKNGAPVVGTATASQTNSDGDTIAAVDASKAFSDPNGDPLTFAASQLPPGLAISSAGLITGTVAKNAAPGTYHVTVTATDDKGAATSETFSWTVNDVPPSTNGTLANQSYIDGQSGIAIATAQGFGDANGNTLAYSASGLPAGLSIDPTTGKITGTIDHDASKNATTMSGSGATLAGSYSVVVTASDGLGGSARQTFSIDSRNGAPTVGTATAKQTNSDGDTISAVDASHAFADPNGDPLTFTASQLPPGLSISSAGLITGTVAKNAQPGNYAVVVTATDDKGAQTSETFTWTIKDVPPTTSGTLANQSYTDGQSGIAIATSQAFTPSNGNALTYTASGLPAGLSIDAASGQITGTIDHDASKNAPTTSGSGATLDGTYKVVVTASDGLGGTAAQSFSIDSSNTAPVVGTNTVAQSNKTGDKVSPVDASKAFSDPNGDPLTYSASNLPKGLSIDSATGVISGTVAADAKPGSYAVRVLATDDKGAATREAITWTITDTPPTVKGTLANQTYADSTATIAIDASSGFTSPNGLALTYTASGLPKGLSIDPSTGKITGQLDHDASKTAPTTSGAGATLDGTYTVTITASDGQGGAAQQVFKIDATNDAPTLVAQTPDQAGADGQTVSLDAAKPFKDRNTGDTFTYAATGLPTGLTIDPASGLISGTIDPHASQPGSFNATVTITDDKGAQTSETFKWTISDVPPVATPALPDRSVDDGTAVTVATSGGFTNPNKVPYTYTATGLPNGLSIDPDTGVISGTIDHDASTNGNGGTYTIGVTADDRQGGTATNSFHLTSSNQAPVVGTKTPAQAALDGDTIAPVDASKAFADPNGDPLTYSASALPAGLVIDPQTGIISGTVSPSAAAGSYSVAITATDDKGSKTTETFAWTIGSVPPQPNGTIRNETFADGTPGIAIDTASAFADRNNNTLTYSATGLPAGLSIDPTTGKITGTLDHDASVNASARSGSGATLDGTYTIAVTAADGIGGAATQTFTIDATNQAPAIAKTTPDQTNTDGDVVSVNTGEAFSDPNTGDLVTYAASKLPPGLTIDPKTGVISGTVPQGDYASSPYNVTVTATDDKGAAITEAFTWIIQPTPPSTLSPIPNVASFDGNALSIDTGSHFTMDGATVFTVQDGSLPKGLSINATTGRISGTIDHDASIGGPNPTGSGRTADSVYSVTVTATNASGSTTQTFALDVANQAPVIGTGTANQNNKDGETVQAVDASQAFSDPNGDPLTYSANNLPPGLTIDMATGKITGTVAGNAYPGDYKVTVTAIDDKGAATSEVFTWTVVDVPPTTNGTIAGRTAPDGSKGISIATAGGFTPTNNNPLYYAATGLPPGLTIDPRTGVITGAIDHDTSLDAPTHTGAGATLDGTYTIAVTAYDGLGGSAMQTFAFDASNTAPAFKQTPDQHSQDGQSVSLAPSFFDPNGDPLTYSAANLPSGLSIDPATGLISGIIDKTALKNGPYTATVTATDDKNAATTETFNWAVDNVAPQATPPLADRSINDGTAVSYATSGGFTNPNGLTLTYSATGLPKGLSIDPATGLISGTLDNDASAATSGGVYPVSVTVDDGQGGTATNTFNLTASNQAPAVGMPLSDQNNRDGDAITPVDTSKAFSDPNPGDVLTYAASNLPKGLTFETSTGAISGNIASDAAPGSYYVTITATDEKGAATPATFTWTIGDVPPMAQGSLPAQHYNDSQNGIDIATAGGFTSPNGLPLTYTATGLPRGLTIDPNTGAITGFISHNASIAAPSYSPATRDGTYTVTVAASDGQGGTATQTFTLDSTNQAPTLGMPTADQHAADGQQVSIDAGKSFADPNTGDTLTFTAAGLPAGLTIAPATGLITGTVDPHASTNGPYSVTVIATDNKGAATPETFRLTVDEVPPEAGTPVAAASAPDGATTTPIDAASHFSSPNGLPLFYAATGLPAGLSIDPKTGTISGTVDHDASKNAPSTSGSGATLDGTYTVTVTASDGQGGVAMQTFTFDATNAAPALTAQTPDQHGADGQSVSLDASKAFTDPNTGDVIVYAASGLPAGLSIDSATGLITGTIDPRASSAGPYRITVTATDDKGATTSETFAWSVADVPPTATSLPDQAAEDGAAVSIATAGGFSNPDGVALTYSASGLPAGLAIDPTTGVISGTLDHDASIGNGSGAGTYAIVVTAADAQGGSARDAFHLTSSNQAPTVGTRTADQANKDGDAIAPVDASRAFSDANGDPLTYAAADLPAGLSIDPATGRITGTVAGNARPGTYQVTVTATDDKGAATSESFAWTIADVPPTAQGTFSAQHFADGQVGVSIATAAGFADANGNALAYAATGLPAGLSIDPSTGTIAGTLDRGASTGGDHGTYTVTVTASDGLGGTATQTLTIVAANTAPTVGTRTADQANKDGEAITPVDVSRAFADANGDPLTYAAANLPAGLSIDPATGQITGTVAGNARPGIYRVTVTATDDKSAATSESFAWTVADVPPAAVGTLTNQVFGDGTAGISIDTVAAFAGTNGNALSFTATGLPAGLAIDPASGRITGTLDHDASKHAPAESGSAATLDGTYAVAVTASDGLGGSATQRFTLDARNAAPVVGVGTADQKNTDGDLISLDSAAAFGDPNAGDVLTYAAGNLPPGLAIDAKTGLITGTVASGDNVGSPYAVTVTATDDKGAATSETLTWTVLPSRPAAASPLPNVTKSDGAVVVIDTASHFAAEGASTTYAATGLPAGLSIDPATGRISGTLDHDASKNAPATSGSGATLDGVYTVTVTAANAGGDTAQSFSLDAANAAPTLGTRTADQANKDGDAITPVDASSAFSDANGDPLTYAAVNLPAGLSIDPATGRITGTVAGNARPGTYQVIVTATDDKGAATSESFAWTIADVPPTAQGTFSAQHLADGQVGVSIATAAGFADANGNALAYAATGLPAGLSIDPSTGTIAGTLDRGASTGGDHGTYTVTVTASDGLGGTATQTLTIVAANQGPMVGITTADQHGQDGQTVALDTAPAFSDANGDPLTYSAANLPAGLSIDPATGRIGGTLAGTASVDGPYVVVVKATDSKGASTTETFNWTVDDVSPTARGTAPIGVGPVPDGTTIAPFDASAAFTDPKGGALTYAATGLPPGLVIDPATGLITGTLDHDASTGGNGGTYLVTVFASDGQGGTASQIYTLEATNQAPATVGSTVDQASAQGEKVSPIDVSQAFADPNPGDVVTYAASGLPKGLAIDPASGLIGGTIAPDAIPGDYAVTVIAADDKGAASAETFQWSVGEVPPATAVGLPPQHYGDGQSVTIDTAGGFASPNGLPLSYDASGLPGGLSIDPATGLITGALDRNASASAPVKLGSGSSLEGIYAVTITATDAFGGTTSQVFAIEVDNVPLALIARTPDQHGRAGQAIGALDLGSAFADQPGDMLTFAATGLPRGLALDPATGHVSGVIDPALRSPGVYTVTVTATDEQGANVAETFLYTVDAVAPSILTPPSFFEPAAALLPNILGAAPARIAGLGHDRSIEAVTPILDVINQTSGAEEKSQVISLDGIVVSTVNGIAPLNGLEWLSQSGEGIVRSGAATNEIGDRIARTQDGIGRGVEPLSTPSNFLGATSIDVDAVGRGESGPSINIETMLRDRVLSISVGSGAGVGDPLARVTVTLADGRPLPAWLRADGKGYLVGKVPGGVESIALKVTSTFASGSTSQRSVTISTDRGTITPLAPRPQAVGRTLSHMVGAARYAAADLSGIARLLD